jgi:hypothetical protein
MEKRSISEGGSLAPERQLAAKPDAFNWGVEFLVSKMDRPRRGNALNPDRSITPEKGGNSKDFKD